MCKIAEITLHLVFGIFLCFLSLVDKKEKCVSVSSLIFLTTLSVFMAGLRMGGAGADDLAWIFRDMACGAMIGIVFLVISYVSDEKIGYGDSLLLLILGIGIGGWSLVCLLEVSSVLMIVTILYLWKEKKISRNTRIAFYPYIFAGYLIYLFDSYFLAI